MRVTLPVPLDSERLERAPGPSTRSPLHRTPTSGPASNNEPSEDVLKALAGVLAPMEHVVLVAPAVGSVMVLTETRVIVVRDGASFRPKTGVRSFAFDDDVAVRIGPDGHRLIIEAAGTAITAFLRADQLERAAALIAEARRRSIPG